MMVIMQVKEGDNVLAQTPFDWESVEEGIQDRLKLHGLSTILQQRTSDIKENPLEKLAAMEEVFSRFAEGIWAKERTVGARTVPAIVEVLAELKGADVGVVQKSWSKLSTDQKDAIKTKYADDVARMEAKRAASEEVDLTDLV